MGSVPLVTLTTDFGTADGYVGVMKGVVLGIAPDARLVDITHWIGAQNVREAAYVLYAAYGYFPRHTVHLAVVDPGVGGERRPIALRTAAGTFVGPDNGLFSYVAVREPVEEAVELADPRYHLPTVSQTFHGRDVFAPAAAHLAAGVRLADLGPAVTDLVTLPPPRLDVTAEQIVGEVVHVDRFGNCVTSVGRLAWEAYCLVLTPAFSPGTAPVQLGAGSTVIAGGQEIAGLRQTYGHVAPGEVLALVGSGAHLEIAVREGSAAEMLGIGAGDAVAIRLA